MDAEKRVPRDRIMVHGADFLLRIRLFDFNLLTFALGGV